VNAAPSAPSPNASSLPGTKSLSAVPPAPTLADVRRAERRLARLRSQLAADEVAEAGLVKASASSQVRSRIVFPYLESSIYEIYAAPDRMTAIELQPGEHLTTENERPKAADTVQWMADTVTAGEGAEKRTIILVKPIVTGVETNMLIPTNKHVYHLLLRSESETYMPLVGFSYPFDEAKARDEKAAAEAHLEDSRERISVPPEQLTFHYKIKGAHVVWRPVRVFDDGTKTYIEMPAETRVWESPALFVMEGSTPLLVNYRVKGDYYIVDRLFEHAQLRVGTKTAVDIYRGRT
jgi:type IV secretion system protein VirB9